MRVKQIVSGLLIGLLCIATGLAQDENIGTETVTVIKSYTPTVADANKINTIPQMTDSVVLQKKNIEYSIFSVPVASTFTPAKGRAAPVKRARREAIYNSYASFALGNFNNAAFDFYTSRDFDRGDKRFDAAINHFSSRGDIDNTPFDTDIADTKIALTLSSKERDLNWTARLAGGHQIYNWYGVREGVVDEALLPQIDEQQTYYNLDGTARFEVAESVITGGEIILRRFWDRWDSGENRIRVAPEFLFPVSDQELTIGVHADYVSGSFTNASLNAIDNTAGIDYSLFQAGIAPTLLFEQDDFTLNLGARIVVGLDNEANDTNFYLYPNVTASYRLADEVAIVYGGLQGELHQNTFFDLVGQNPYVSPTLTIQPTDRQYDAFAGLKGQLSSNLSYNVKGSYSAENRIPLFKLNPDNTTRLDEPGYVFGNSFDVFYDDIRTFGLFGELSLDIDRDFTLGINAEILDYSTETGNPAWNLPTTKGSLFMNGVLGERWYFGANLFYFGEREDLISQAVANTLPQDFPSAIVQLDSFFDANAHLGYRFGDQLSVFARANNIANNQYQRWANFRVQSFQVLGGIRYQFDF